MRSLIVILFGVVASLPSIQCDADVLQPGKPFPQISFLGSDQKKLDSYRSYLGKKTVLFVYASW